MVRTQIQLEERQATALRALAKERNCSVAALIRHGVDRLLAESVGPGEAERRRRAIAVAGRFRSGVPDLGREHDRYLDEEFET